VTDDLDLIAEALPAYDVGEELGRGAWGVVIAGTHRRLRRPVAIKQLPRAFGTDPGVRARFLAEAQLLASLNHPHIVPIYDYIEHEGLCLLVMERLTGGTVANRFQTRGFTAPEACALVVAACAGLEHAHGKGVLHRDVKPENLVFDGEDTLKVADFGIAKVIGGASTMSTRAGYVLGTPAYIAPEQAQSGELSPATDVYAAGTVLFELLAGQLPYTTDDPVAALYQHVHEDPRRLRSVVPEAPAELEAVCAHALRRDAGERYGSAEDLGVAITEAATAVWGPEWLDMSGVVVVATGRLGRMTR
jgi:serine/threonine-protein kinase